MTRILVSRTAAKALQKAPAADRDRLLAALRRLQDDLRSPRLDARPLAGTDPPKHRLRVGAWRAVYVVEEDTVRVIDVFRRGRGYR